MPRVGPLLSPWAASETGAYLGISHGVSRARNFVKWGRYARNFARAAAIAGGGYSAVAGLAAEGAYQGISYLMKRRANANARPAKRRRFASRRRGRVSSGRRFVKNVGGRSYRARTRRYGSRKTSFRRSYKRSYRTSRRVTSIPMSMAEYGPIVKQSCKIGSGRVIPKAISKLTMAQRFFRFQLMNVMPDPSATSCPGFIRMANLVSGTDGTQLPMFMVCLNHANNQSASTIGPYFQVVMNNGGDVSFTNVGCQNPDGEITQFKWILEKHNPSTVATNADSEYSRIQQAWYSIKMNCYGARTRPTYYCVEIVSFLDEDLDPYDGLNGLTRRSFYQNYIRKYVSTPMQTSTSLRTKYLTVHKRLNFVVPASFETESDKTPHSRQINLFVRDGNIYNYAYTQVGFNAAGADEALLTRQYVTQNVNNVSQAVDWPQSKARKWLIVRAMNTQRQNDVAACNRDNTPSMDLLIRKCEYANTF